MPIDVKLISPENVLVNDNGGSVAYDYNEESGCLKITIQDINCNLIISLSSFKKSGEFIEYLQISWSRNICILRL